jgi:hypothetical protein
VKTEVSGKVIAISLIATIGFFVYLDAISTPATPIVEDTFIPTPKPAVALQEVFNVPSLVGLSLSELETTLGTPSYDKEPTASYIQSSEIRTWEKTWSKSGYALTATYNIDTNAIEDLFLGTDTDAALETFKSQANILTVGGLSESDPKYTMEFVKIKAVMGNGNSPTPTGFTGVIVRSSN